MGKNYRSLWAHSRSLQRWSGLLFCSKYYVSGIWKESAQTNIDMIFIKKISFLLIFQLFSCCVGNLQSRSRPPMQHPFELVIPKKYLRKIDDATCCGNPLSITSIIHKACINFFIESYKLTMIAWNLWWRSFVYFIGLVYGMGFSFLFFSFFWFGVRYC